MMEMKELSNKYLTYFLITLVFITGNLIKCSDDSTVKNNRSIEEVTAVANPVNIIPDSNNYFITDTGQIYSVNEDGVEKVIVKDKDDNELKIIDLFKQSNDIYFTTEKINESDPENPIISYYKKKDETITKIDTLPKKPNPARSQLNDTNFTIENFDYEGTLCSDVKNIITESGVERFLLVNGYVVIIDKGLFFNVSEGRPGVRNPGLYFWPVDRSSINVVLPKGILW